MKIMEFHYWPKNGNNDIRIKGTRVIQLLDPYQEPRYTEPTDDLMDEAALEHIYRLTAPENGQITSTLQLMVQ